MTSTEQLARDADLSRAELAAGLTELRARLTPQNLRQEAARAVRNSGPARFAAGLQEDAANSAVPIAMLAAGVLWAMANQKAYGRSQAAPGSVASLVSAGGGLMSTALSFIHSLGAATTRARARGEAAVASAKPTMEAAARASSAARDSGLAAGSRAADGARNIMKTARSKGADVLEASLDATERASRAVSAAATLAGRDPVFIAGVGLAAAGIATAVLGISRQRDEAAAARELVKEAQEQPQSRESQQPASAYDRDLTGASELASAG